MLFSLISYHQVNGEDVQGLSHARVIGMLRKITGTVELEIKRYALVKGFSNIIKMILINKLLEASILEQ